MNYKEKLKYLKQNHYDIYRSERNKIEEQEIDNLDILCLCGRLATGLHLRSCSKFQTLVSKKTVNNLQHLIDNDNKTNG